MSLIRELSRFQEGRGYLDDGDLKEVAERLNVPFYRVQEVVSFYPHFRLSPPPRMEVAVCQDLSCHLGRARETRGALAEAASDFGQEVVVSYLEGKEIKKAIYVPGRLVSLVVA